MLEKYKMDFLENLPDSNYLYDLGGKILIWGTEISAIYAAFGSIIYFLLLNTFGETFFESTALTFIKILSITVYIIIATFIVSNIIFILAYIKSRKEI
jgi:hypothetical protein